MFRRFYGRTPLLGSPCWGTANCRRALVLLQSLLLLLSSFVIIRSSSTITITITIPSIIITITTKCGRLQRGEASRLRPAGLLATDLCLRREGAIVILVVTITITIVIMLIILVLTSNNDGKTMCDWRRESSSSGLNEGQSGPGR